MGERLCHWAIEPQFYARLSQACGITDPPYQRQWDESEWPALRGKLAAVFRTRACDEWCALLEGSDACFSPVLSMTEAAGHPHNRARNTFVAQDGVVQPGPAPRFDRTPTKVPPKASVVGQHSRDLLQNIGYGAAAIAALVDAGVVQAARSET
jgi:alpha-methylacyl-CoA racemase